MLLLADIAARFLVMPGEMPLGVMTGLIGVPFLFTLPVKGFVRKRGLNESADRFRSKKGRVSFLVHKRTVTVFAALALLTFAVL
ncbi:hypothetical protein PACILC2_31960 [Paenibacillus cisolokensis]|uniref:Iron ABC transporter permease n=1 Tax=Paenibacillus cisolokensis TaxID=1658519 RepID=A0ABQ4N8Q4_9BACL|nr:iron chelate uptake ABC transporter family permease subunit [Paenibacillus cisolokensis]GIQ64628.1 hypothetical protein PACILC2_31960 [Paenibacillus cisolokensis]